MAYSNIKDQNFKAITNFNISLGLSEKERDNIALEYKRKNIITKRFAGSGADFPKRLPKYNEDKVIDISNRYFTPDLDDIQLEQELQRDFINSKNKDALQRKLALEEQKKIKEIKELNDAGIVLPEGVNYFSEEGRAYIRSEASKHPNGFNEYINDKIKAKETEKIINEEKRIATVLDAFIKKMINEVFDATELNIKVNNVIDELFEENLANLEPNIKETAKRQLETEVKERIIKGKSAGGAGAGMGGILPRGSIVDSGLGELALNASKATLQKLAPQTITINNKIYTNVLGYIRLDKGLVALRTTDGIRIFDREDNLVNSNIYKSSQTINNFVKKYNPN
jgi:hypothetical protein